MDEPIAITADFSVLYEDEQLIVVDKAAPLLTHPTGPKQEPTLWHGLRELLLYELATGGQVSIINRLDRETSGITLVAKTAQAARALGIAMQNRELHKRYLAIAQGCPTWDFADCCEPILRKGDVEESLIHVRQRTHPQGKASRSCFTVLERHGERSLMQCQLHTGRMHQIRVHLEHLGHPLVGDKIYGGNPSCYLRFMEEGWSADLEKELHIPRQALHASELSFPHPVTGERCHITSPLPADMQALLV